MQRAFRACRKNGRAEQAEIFTISIAYLQDKDNAPGPYRCTCSANLRDRGMHGPDRCKAYILSCQGAKGRSCPCGRFCPWKGRFCGVVRSVMHWHVIDRWTRQGAFCALALRGLKSRDREYPEINNNLVARSGAPTVCNLFFVEMHKLHQCRTIGSIPILSCRTLQAVRLPLWSVSYLLTWYSYGSKPSTAFCFPVSRPGPRRLFPLLFNVSLYLRLCHPHAVFTCLAILNCPNMPGIDHLWLVDGIDHLWPHSGSPHAVQVALTG